MFEKIKIIREFKKMRRASINGRFLLSSRKKVEAEIGSFPAPDEKIVPVSVLTLIKAKTMPVVLILAVIAVFGGGGGVAMASQNSIPGELLYPVKTLTEEIRAAVAVGAERKTELQAEFAARRVEEISELLRQDSVDPAGLDIALLRFEEHVARAADVIEKEKERGREVSAVAKTIGEKFDADKELLKMTVKAREKNLEKTGKELLARAEEARRVQNSAALTELTNQIDEIETKRKTIELRRKTAEEAIESEEERIEKHAGDAEEARKAMTKAVMAKEEILREADEKGVTAPPAIWKIFETHIGAARNAFEAGRFQEATQRSKAAKEELRRVEKIFNDEISSEIFNSEKNKNTEEIKTKETDKNKNSLPPVIRHREENDADDELKEIEEKLIELNRETRFAPLRPLAQGRNKLLSNIGVFPPLR